MEVYGISEFLGIVQHRDGSLLNSGTAVDARNMDTSDGNLSVAKGYEKKSSNALPGTEKVLRLIPVDDENILAVTKNNIYSGTYTAWNTTPVYTFETALPDACQVSYALAQINTDNIVIVATGNGQMIKVLVGDTVTASQFGTGQYCYESTVASYADLVITLSAEMSEAVQQKLTVEGGLYINDTFLACTATTATTVTLAEEPSTPPVATDTVKIRGGGSTAHCNYVCMHYNRLFAAGDPDNPTRLYWSTIPGDGRTIEHWLSVSSSVDLSGGFVEVGNNANDPIIGICEMSNQILIFKRYSIYRLYGDRPSYYTVERVERFTENMSNAGVALKSDVPYWLTKSGIRYFDGSDVQLIDGGNNYLSKFLETISSIGQSKGFMARDKLYFSCRTGTGSYDDAVIVFDMTRGVYMIRDGFNVADMCSFDGRIYLINDGRYLYEFDRGTSYAGQAISAYWETQPTDLNAKFYKKTLKELFFRAIGKAIIIDIKNGGSTAKERRVIQNEEMVEIPLRSEECRLFNLKLSNESGSAFTIKGGLQIIYEGSVRPR